MKTRLRKNKGGTYSVVIKGPDGRDKSIKTSATTKEEAHRLAKEAEIKELQVSSDVGILRSMATSVMLSGRRLTCTSAAQDYLKCLGKLGRSPGTVERTRVILDQWCRDYGVGDMMVNAFTDDHVSRFINAKDGTTIATRRSRLSGVRGFCEWLGDHGYRPDNPAGAKRVSVDLRSLSHKEKEPKVRVPVTHKEYLRIIDEAPIFWRFATMFSYWLGLRMVDIACLEWEQFTSSEIIAWTRKSGARVALPLADEITGGGILLDALGGIPIEDPKYLFPVERKMALDMGRRANLSVDYGRLLRRVGVEGKSFHCLRHSFATRLKENGMELKDIARLIGHSDEKTTEIYAH